MPGYDDTIIEVGRHRSERCPIFANFCQTLSISYSLPLLIVLEHPVMCSNRSFRLSFFVYVAPPLRTTESPPGTHKRGAVGKSGQGPPTDFAQGNMVEWQSSGLGPSTGIRPAQRVGSESKDPQVLMFSFLQPERLIDHQKAQL